MTPSSITTLSDLVEQMATTVPIRRQLRQEALAGKLFSPAALEHLKKSFARLCASVLNTVDSTIRLQATADITIETEIAYEIAELERDIRFCQGEASQLFTELREQAGAEGESLAKALMGKHFHYLISDRDGTVNNYCARYNTSIQSVYNAVALERFTQQKLDGAVILTSAPLKDIGILDITVNSPEAITFAASKGREFVDTQGRFHHFPIDDERARLIEAVYENIAALVEKPEFAVFALIGSGLQKKFGQVTVARQDNAGSIPAKDSVRFLELVRDLMQEHDSHGELLRLEDTGKDIEIIVTLENGEGEFGFNKRDGVRFIAKELGIVTGPLLACGDTASDIPLALGAREIDHEAVVVFVTVDSRLRERVRKKIDNAFFVPNPDALIGVLASLTRTA